MITTKKELREVLKYEHDNYMRYMFPTHSRRIFGHLKHEPVMSIWRWQKASRKCDYFKYRSYNGGSVFEKLAYLYFVTKRNIIGERLGIEAITENTNKGLFIYHYIGGIIFNAKIGSNCHLHGNNCIGNNGPHDISTPILGDNVTLGVGAKVIGGVYIADNVTIAAGAVVVKDILEPGVTVAGIPAKIIIRHRHND